MRYHESFRRFGELVPDKASIFISYDNELAHKIYAGADMILVPSRYEPCGLNQIYGLKYGAVPVVRATGGLIDTVEDFDAEQDSGTGFRFVEPDAAALEKAILKAVAVYREQPETWKRLMIRGMNKDFSWKRSALEYLALYEKAVKQRRESLDQRMRG
jgi:starch synthase